MRIERRLASNRIPSRQSSACPAPKPVSENSGGSYSETDLTGGGFGLSYDAMNGTYTRSELGARFDNPTLLNGQPLILRAQLAWAHDWVTNPARNAAFESLPGTSFTVNGAPIPKNSALTLEEAEWWLNANWSLIAKFDGEFGSGSQTYGGSGTLRYTW